VVGCSRLLVSVAVSLSLVDFVVFEFLKVGGLFKTMVYELVREKRKGKEKEKRREKSIGNMVSSRFAPTVLLLTYH
jgi:hypothetical protein